MIIKPKSDKVPKEMQAIYGSIIGLTDPFCEKHLNEEYAQRRAGGSAIGVESVRRREGKIEDKKDWGKKKSSYSFTSDFELCTIVHIITV